MDQKIEHQVRRGCFTWRLRGGQPGRWPSHAAKHTWTLSLQGPSFRKATDDAGPRPPPSPTGGSRACHGSACQPWKPPRPFRLLCRSAANLTPAVLQSRKSWGTLPRRVDQQGGARGYNFQVLLSTPNQNLRQKNSHPIHTHHSNKSH